MEQDMVVSILGVPYKIETHKISKDEVLDKNKFDGYCSMTARLIVIADLTEEKYFEWSCENEKNAYRKAVLRHEITHAFLNESGLSSSTVVPVDGWAKNEEMVDWIAIQFPKMLEVFEEVGCI